MKRRIMKVLVKIIMNFCWADDRYDGKFLHHDFELFKICDDWLEMEERIK